MCDPFLSSFPTKDTYSQTKFWMLYIWEMSPIMCLEQPLPTNQSLMICLHSCSDTERDQLVFGTQSILKLGRPLSSMQGTLSHDISCLSQTEDDEILESLEDLGVFTFGTHLYSGLTHFLFDPMGASALDLELEAGCRDDFDLTGLGFTGASLGFGFLADIPFLPLGVWFLSLGVELLPFVAFQSSMFERDLEGFLLEYLPFGAFFHPCAQ